MKINITNALKIILLGIMAFFLYYGLGFFGLPAMHDMFDFESDILDFLFNFLILVILTLVVILIYKKYRDINSLNKKI